MHILAVNNIRDRAQDELVGKKTLAVRLGDVKARRMFVALLVLAHAAAIAKIPIRISNGEVRRDSQRPATLAIAKETKAAFLTALADANPRATNRVGPILFSSVPLTPSL